MWLSQSALDRIRELELALKESVSREVYQASLARIAELERQTTDLHVLYQAERESVESRLLGRIAEVEERLDAQRAEHARQVRWLVSMRLRRAGSLPLPATPEEKAEAKQDEKPLPPSDVSLGQIEAIVVEGKRLGMGREQIEQAVRDAVPGVTEETIAAALSGRVM